MPQKSLSSLFVKNAKPDPTKATGLRTENLIRMERCEKDYSGQQ